MPKQTLHKLVIHLLLLVPLIFTGKMTALAEDMMPLESSQAAKDKSEADYQRALKRLDDISRIPGGDLDEFAKIAQQMFDEWNQRDEQKYFALAGAICRILSAHDFGLSAVPQQRVLARKYAKLALQKAQAMSLHTEVGLLLCLPGSTEPAESQLQLEEQAKERSQEATLWFHAWQRLNQEIDLGFDTNQRYQPYVDPPKGYENFPTPVSPNVIKDPKTRSDYEAAIAANKQKAERYVRQSELHELYKYFSPFMESYLITAYSTPPYKTEELRHLLERYNVDADRKARILKGVAEAIRSRAEAEQNKVPQTALDKAEGR